MTIRVKAGVYFALWIPAAVVAILVASTAIGAFNAVSMRGASLWVGVGLNVVPALVVGLTLYLPLALWANRDRQFGGWRGHLVRASVLYALGITLGALMAVEAGNPDFWLYGQLILWPWLVAVGGILADLAAWGLKGAARAAAGAA